MSEEKFGDLQNGDVSNEAFWQKLSETLQETMTMLVEMAEERGIDLDELDIDDGEDLDDPFGDKPVIHMATHMAKSYIDIVENWFNDNVYVFEEDARNLAAIYEVDSSYPRFEEDTVTLIDSVEVIRGISTRFLSNFNGPSTVLKTKTLKLKTVSPKIRTDPQKLH